MIIIYSHVSSIMNSPILLHLKSDLHLYFEANPRHQIFDFVKTLYEHACPRPQKITLLFKKQNSNTILIPKKIHSNFLVWSILSLRKLTKNAFLTLPLEQLLLCNNSSHEQLVLVDREIEREKGITTCLISSWKPVHMDQLALIIQHQLSVRQHVRRQRG